jgi:Uma2 family endonuclease
VIDSPPYVVAEVVHGILYQSPRPAAPHAVAATAISEELGPPFKRGRGGPGGWMILYEPELHLGEHILVPDLAGWRRERMPVVPDAAYFELTPDWACEVLSPSTRALDRGAKLGVYAEFRVPHMWLVEPLDRLVEVLRLDGSTYRIVQTATGNDPARLEPFEAIEFPLAALWAR